MFKYQVISDIHLENYDKINIPDLIKPLSEVLFLAGDIGHIENKLYTKFMNYVSENWEIIYVVLGNHEFYCNSNKIYTYDEMYEMYENFFLNYPNIILVTEGYTYKINKKYTNGNNIYIIGGIGIPTLEDKIKNIGEDYFNIDLYYKTKFNDFNYIYMSDKDDILNKKNNKKLISTEYFNNLSNISKQLLIESINELSKLDEEYSTILLTHFPYGKHILTSSSKFSNDSEIKKAYFCNSNSEPINRSIINSVNLLIAGHTHYSYEFTYNGSKYISNQFGYKYDKQNNYDSSKVFNSFLEN
jgi:predicted MPP superfamily phosphohydrolase